MERPGIREWNSRAVFLMSFLVLHNINNKDVIIIVFKSLPVHLPIGSLELPKLLTPNRLIYGSNIEETIFKIN